MSIETAAAVWISLALYLAAGALFAAVFVIFGAARIDKGARGMAIQARLILLPGVALLWPLRAWKWLRGAEPPRT
jgi:hypothetical protein